MSQWLTSGRNRLLEKQQQKQRFGLNNIQAVANDRPRGSVSSGTLRNDRGATFTQCVLNSL